MSPSARPEGRSGQSGEILAAEWLRRRGYRIEARDLRTRHGEIDLLVRRGRDWAAVEVKARQDHPAPERTVEGPQLERIRRALLSIAPRLLPAPRRLAIDVVAVRWQEGGPPEIRHFPDLLAFRRRRGACALPSVPEWEPADTRPRAPADGGPLWLRVWRGLAHAASRFFLNREP